MHLPVTQLESRWFYMITITHKSKGIILQSQSVRRREVSQHWQKWGEEVC